MRRPELVARLGRRPEGWLGRMLARLMARETRTENEAALDLLEIRPGDRVLEIGFGHGRSIASAARRAQGGLVAGVDFSPDMVAMAQRRNQSLIDRGLVDLRHADSGRLPFQNGMFDRAFSVHTVYFWTDPGAHHQEIRRVLKDGGRFILGFRPPDPAVLRAFPASVYTFRSGDEIRRLLLSAGFADVSAVEPGPAARSVVLAVGHCGGTSAI